MQPPSQILEARLGLGLEMGQVAGHSAKILIVSNQQTTTGALTSLSLQQQKYDVIVEQKPADALQRWAEVSPAVVILDLNHTRNVVLQLVRALRAETVTPILLLSRSMTVEEQQEMYDAGVDDCLIKPVSPSIFLAKIRVWLRHSWAAPTETLEPLKVGDLSLEPSTRTVHTARGGKIELTNLELRLLHALMSRPRRLVTSEELIRAVWGDASASDSTVLKSLVYRLRQKLEANPNSPMTIQTVAGSGYMYVAT